MGAKISRTGRKTTMSGFRSVQKQVSILSMNQSTKIRVPSQLGKKRIEISFDVSLKSRELQKALKNLYLNTAKLYKILPAKSDKFSLLDVSQASGIFRKAKSIIIDTDPITNNFRFIIGKGAYSYFAMKVKESKVIFKESELYNLSRGIRPEDVAKVGPSPDQMSF